LDYPKFFRIFTYNQLTTTKKTKVMNKTEIFKKGNSVLYTENQTLDSIFSKDMNTLNKESLLSYLNRKLSSTTEYLNQYNELMKSENPKPQSKRYKDLTSEIYKYNRLTSEWSNLISLIESGKYDSK